MNAHSSATDQELEVLSVVCIWDGTPRSADFFALNKMLFHLVARCCEASCQKKSLIKIMNKNEGVLKYPVLCFHVERHKTSSSQNIQVFPHKTSPLMCLYFSLAYKLVLDNGEDDHLFPEYAKKLGSDDSSKIDSKTAAFFNEYYKYISSCSKKYQQEVLLGEDEKNEYDMSALADSRTSHSLGEKAGVNALAEDGSLHFHQMVFRCGCATKNLHTAFDYIFNSTNKDTICGKILGQWTKLSNGKITGGCPPNANDVVTNMEMMNKFVSNLFRHQKYLANTEVKRILLGSILLWEDKIHEIIADDPSKQYKKIEDHPFVGMIELRKQEIGKSFECLFIINSFLLSIPFFT